MENTLSVTHLSPFDVPELRTSRLVLRKWRSADAANMFAYASDPEVTRYAMWPRHQTIHDTHRDIAEALERYTQHDWIYWGIEHGETGRFIGSIGFPIWRRSDNNAEIGYALSREFWGQGIMHEAMCAVIGFGQHEMQLHRLEAKCILNNTRSIRLLERFGFQLEGVRREAALTEEGYLDVGMYAVLFGSDRLGTSDRNPPVA